MRRLALAVLLAGLAGGVAACDEKLTTPGDCPALCPGGSAPVFDTVIVAEAGLDSTLPETSLGYVDRGSGEALLVSNLPAVPTLNNRAVIRFAPRAATVQVDSVTSLPYTIDSVAFELRLVDRDTTLLQPLALQLFRLPGTVDSAVTYAQAAGVQDPANLVTTIPVSDTLKSGTLRVVLTGADLDRVALADGDSLAVSVALDPAGLQTGVRIGGLGTSGGVPAFITYGRVEIADTAKQRQLLRRSATLTTFVSESPAPVNDTWLVAGGAPSKRALIRFVLPPAIRDSATIVRATLELVPAVPFPGLPGDPARLDARAVLSDLGAKSPLVPLTSIAAPNILLAPGSTETVRLEVTPYARAWQREDALPASIVLVLNPEAASFTTAAFESTRSPQQPGAPAPGPRLHVTYTLPFGFEAP